MGTYCPPLAVFLDTAFLRTLPQRHLSNGAAEIMKMACIKDAQLFALLEQHSADLLATNFQVLRLRLSAVLRVLASEASCASAPVTDAPCVCACRVRLRVW